MKRKYIIGEKHGGKYNMNSSKEVKSICLSDLFWNLVSHWRSILIFALVLCLSLCGYKVLKNIEKNKEIDKAINKQVEVRPEDGVKEHVYYEMLTDTEANAVDSAVELAELIKKSDEYVKTSSYFKLDPYNEKIRILKYVIKASKNNAKMLRDAYIDYVNSGVLASDIGSGNNEAEILEVNELIFSEAIRGQNKVGYSSSNEYESTSENVDSEMFSIYIVGNKQEDIADRTKNAIERYTEKIEELLGKHEIQFVSEDDSVIVDSILASKQREMVLNCTNYRTSLNNLLDSFTEEQVLAYKELTDEINQVETGNDYSNEEKVSLTSSVKKYATLGIVGGIMLGVIFWILIYIFSLTAKTPDDITDTLGFYLMADFVPYRTKGKCFGYKLDAWLNRQRYRNRTDEQAERELLVSNIKVTCQKHELKSVYLTSSIQLNASENEKIENLIRKLKENGIEAALGLPVARSAESFEKMIEYGNVIFIEKIGVSRMDNMEKMGAMAEKQDVKVLGIVVV